MHSAVILHNIEDAKHCIENGININNELFSTHPSVDIFLKEEKNIDCRCLSRFFSENDVINCLRDSSSMVDETLDILDKKIGPIINEEAGLNIKYFVPMYSYFAKYHMLGYLAFYRAIEKAVSSCQIKDLKIYHYTYDYFFHGTDITLDQSNSHVLDKLGTETIKYKESSSGFYSSTSRSIDVVGLLKKIAKILLKRNKTGGEGTDPGSGATILIDEELYNLSFLKGLMGSYKVITLRDDKKNGFSSESNLDMDKLIVRVAEAFEELERGPIEENKFVSLLIKDIKKDFIKNIPELLQAVLKLKQRHESEPISFAIWGLPPVSREKALIFEYLKKENVKILGAQHGASHGDSYEPWHFDSDFSRCDYYVSYGFNQEDLNRLYPDRKAACQIIPLGRSASKGKNDAAKSIDILFPISCCYSIFGSGMSMLTPDKLTDRQIALLEYFNSLEKYKIYVKFAPISTFKYCSVLAKLKSLKNLNLVFDVSLSEFINNYSPRAVVMDCASTPLFDTLHLDAEIFLLNDFTHPFEKQALIDLEKRVHYSDDVNKTISQIDLFLNNKLPKKKDDSFYRHYVNDEGASEARKKYLQQLIYSTINCN